MREHVRDEPVVPERPKHAVHGKTNCTHIRCLHPPVLSDGIAFQKNQKMLTDAFQKNIIIVTPTTLLAALRGELIDAPEPEAE